MVCDQFAVIQIIVPLYIMSFFCGCILFLFGFEVHGCDYTHIYSSWVLLASWTCKYMSFTKFGKFSAIISLGIIFASLPLSSLSGTPTTHKTSCYQPIGPWGFFFLQNIFSFYFRFFTGHQNSAYFLSVFVLHFHQIGCFCVDLSCIH